MNTVSVQIPGRLAAPPVQAVRRLLLAALLMLALPVHADDDDRQPPPGVRPAVEALQVVQGRHPGRVLKVELEHEDDDHGGGWLYEVKVLTARGRVLEVMVDAFDLRIVEVEGLHHRHGSD